MRFTFILTIFLLMGCSRIPDVQVSSDASYLKHVNGVLHFHGEPFSGYIIENYSSGSLSELTPFYEGKAHGEKKGYYEDGSLMYSRAYTLGKKEGTHKGFFPDGQPRFEYKFEAGENIGTHYDWYEGGQLAKLTNYKDGKPFGVQKMWRSDGKIRSNYVIREDGRRYGLVGIKRCKNINTEAQGIQPLTAAVYNEK